MVGEPTVVSAYYPIPSKFPPELYWKWIREFWPETTCPLVFFTDPIYASLVKSYFAFRPKTRIVALPFHELNAFRSVGSQIWKEQHALDPEKEIHSPELYSIWYEKKEFVLRAIAENPFQSDRFIWCDAGICRYPEWMPEVRTFGLYREKIPAGRMLLLIVKPFRKEDCVIKRDGIPGDFTQEVRLGGGILASDVAGWNRWSKAYDAMLERYIRAGRFAGKDQNLMASMILDETDICLVVSPPECMTGIERWFQLLFYLSRP
jgi:hypothetical protein